MTVVNQRGLWRDAVYRILACPFHQKCRAECQPQSNLTEEAPIPDFCGRSYKGLVIIGANPGKATSKKYIEKDAKRAILAEQFKNAPTSQNFEEVHDFIAGYMGEWKNNVVAENFRNDLHLNVEEIAYVNLVKCRTKLTASHPYQTVGETITRRCWGQNTKSQLDLLQPRYVIFLWKGVRETLEELDITLARHKDAGVYNGNRSKPYPERIAEIKPIFEAFNKEEK